ncbi:myosin heavy chain non-muscle [Tripterygium wilfordii]|uniref:Myosin heavy chain non-muscle n=1 Tax=Tripterygium wilfordii TaxID=458696 RepID=A0A7J7CYW1_TRIWF|nr:synaptonemal complex protein 1 [Tripterygium wilfordii]KAF5739264.1 myosin heavy chain non-muscle [Tripterygium wilfordii]
MAREQEEEDMDSLFEGMELFTPSQTVNDDPQHSSPLDENLFSNLTIVTSNPTTSTTSIPSQSQSDDPIPISTPATVTTATAISRNISRKKKRAAGLRIGFGRDSRLSSDLPSDDHDDTTIRFHEDEKDARLTSSSDDLPSHDHEGINLRSHNEENDGSVDEDDNGTEFEHIKAQIHEKLNRARNLVASASAARKDSVKRRRKVVQNVNLASQKHRELELQLEDACEAEDFEKAERISDSLAAAEKEKQLLLNTLRDADADCDSIENKMQEALQFQLDAEQESAFLLQNFATDAANNADLVLKNAEGMSSIEMDEWFSSTEALEGKKIELEIESHLISEARDVLNDSIEPSIEDHRREKEILYQKKETLTVELQKLLALVKEKEKEISENDSTIKAVEERIADIVSGFQEMQSSIDDKYNKLQSGLSQLHLESDDLSTKKKKIDEFLSEEDIRGEKLRELARISADEAKTYEAVVDLRKNLMKSILKSREHKTRLAKSEERLSEDLEMLRHEVSAARASLQELSSTKSSIQQNIASFKQKILFIDKRVPELETEKKVAATARNFKEAARIAAEAKKLSFEKEGVQIDMEKALIELEKLEDDIKNTISKLQETEGLILSKEKELAKARFQRLLLIAGAAIAERSAALELGDTEEANLLLAEAEEAKSEAKKLQPSYNFSEEELVYLPRHFISMELVSNLARDQLAELATSVSADD